MREKEGRHQAPKLGITYRRTYRNWISAIHRASKLDSITYIQFHDRGAWSSEYYITTKELTHSFAVILVSAGAFGIGLGELIAEILTK